MDNGNGQNQDSGNESSSSSGIRTTSPKITLDQAMSYLKEIEQTFPNEIEKYNKFLQIIKDFKAERHNHVGVIESVKELFKGHNHLLIGLNTFLPKGYEIIVDDDDYDPLDKEIVFEKAKTYARKIMNRFQNEEHVYMSFLNILKSFKDNNWEIAELYNKVATLFKDHQDLLGEFTKFLPRNDNNDVVEESSGSSTNM